MFGLDTAFLSQKAFHEQSCCEGEADVHCDDSFPRFRRKAHCQLLVMGDQICAGLRSKHTW